MRCCEDRERIPLFGRLLLDTRIGAFQQKDVGNVTNVLLFLAWLVVSPLHLMGASHVEKASYGPIFTTSNHVSPRYVQVLVVHNVIYLIDQDGLVKAVWMRHKYFYLLWQHFVAPSSKLLKVDHNVVYLAAPDGSLVALRTTDGAVLWTKRGAR